MRGLDRLIAIRRSGMKPAGLVKVATDSDCYAYEGWVVCDSADTPEKVDLRPFVGLSVLVSGATFDTVDAWARAIASAGAKNVAVLVAGDFPTMNDAAILKHNGEMLA